MSLGCKLEMKQTEVPNIPLMNQKREFPLTPLPSSSWCWFDNMLIEFGGSRSGSMGQSANSGNLVLSFSSTNSVSGLGIPIK